MISWKTIQNRVSGWTRKIFSHTPRLVDTRHDFLLMQRALGRRAPNFRQFRYMARVLPKSEKIVFLVARTIFIFSLVALAGGYLYTFRQTEPTVGGEYVEGVVGSPRLINPIFSSQNEVDMGLVRLIYSGLMRFDTQGKAVPDLAESYTVSQDQKVYTFKLRSATWHDDKPVTANDIAFTFEILKDKTVASPLAPAFAGAQVKVLDEKTVEFTLSEAYPAFLSALTVGIIPEHIWGSVPRDQIRLAETNVKPIGSGPYAFKRIIKESNGFISRYELERFPNYYGTGAHIKEIAFQFYSDYEGGGGALEALRTKKVLGLSFVPAVYRDKIPTQHVDLHTLQVPQYTALFFNLEGESAVLDKNVRQGLGLAINKFKILQDTLSDEGTVLEGPILPGFPGFTEAKVTGANPDEANTLLDKTWPRVSVDDYKKVLVADYIREHLTPATVSSTTSTPSIVPNDTATELAAKAAVDELLPSAQLFYRKNSAQKYLTIRLVTADTVEYREAATLLAGYWQDIGVRTDITFVSPRDIGRIALKNREYDVLLYGVIVGSDPDQFPFWHSSQANYPGLNLSGYTNSKVDEVLNKIRQTTDEAALVKLYADFQKLLQADVPAVFLYSPHYTYALDKSIHGFGVERITEPADRFANVVDWYMKVKTTFKFN